MKTISGILILVALAISGCSTAVSPGKSSRIDVQKTGLVLVTLIKTGPDNDPKNVSIQFPFRPVDHSDSSFKKWEITSGKELWLVEVPPGRYQIADWTLWCFDPRTEIAEVPFEFEVRAGEVTYIGRLEAAIVTQKNKQGQQMYEWVQPVLENHYGRALAVFRQQYPALASVPVVNAAPIKLFAWNPSGRSPTYWTTTTVSSMGSYGTYFPTPPSTTPRMLGPSEPIVTQR